MVCIVITFTCCTLQLQPFTLCRQGSESVEAQVQLQAEADRWQRASSELGLELREAQAGREQAEEHLERLQGSLRDLQRHSQDRGNYDELQARFKEVSNQQVHCTAHTSHVFMLLPKHSTSRAVVFRQLSHVMQHCLHPQDAWRPVVFVPLVPIASILRAKGLR